MVSFNLDGQSPKEDIEREYVPEDSYPAVIHDISDIKTFAVWNKPNETEEKMVITFAVSVDGKQVNLPMFAKPVVTKGSGTYSNSKMFDLLEVCGLMEEAKKIRDEIEVMDSAELKNKTFVDFLSKNLLQKTCKVITKTIKKGTSEQYSVVDKLLRFGA